MAAEQQKQEAFEGGCHCGACRYLVALHVPKDLDDKSDPADFRVERCNCTSCHGFGHLHVKPNNEVSSFVVLSPLELSEMGDYRCNSGTTSWWFCKKCGGRPFNSEMEGREITVSEIENPVLREKVESLGCKRVWIPTKAEYLSVNGQTLKHNPKLDWALFVDKGLTIYLDSMNLPENIEDEEVRPYKPWPGGTY